ncbi:hypothetical protein GOP47_0022111 [Adiantum capillus-veneris]|uniref:Telomere repeat-binding protein 1-6-like ubiquitin-like domain-containing protein n=1 Tax=Adiantum capillus-veneris TaxID=13818 RepID=A0A9D4Z6T7_ADICA|nr:hypothetical protein GOP47_0022111 [Adiantum capillus-veneris]
MEGPYKSRKFHFPGYDGAVPKATRTSRGRSAYQRNMNKTSADLNCIELLATVAGQVLQAKSLREENAETQSASASETKNPSGRVSSCQVNLPSVRSHQVFVPGKSLFEDVSKLENRQDSNNMQETFGKDEEKVAVSNFLKGTELPTNYMCLQNAMNELVPDPSEGNCNREEESTSEVNILTQDSSAHTSLPKSSNPGHLGSLTHFNSLDESNSFSGRNLFKGGTCVTLLPDNIPQPLCFSSGKEAPTHVHKQSHSLCSEQPLETHLDFSQDLLRLQAKDDDDNFSDLVVPATTVPVGHLMPVIENTQLMQSQQIIKLHKEEASVTKGEMKGIVNDGVIGGDLHCLQHFSSQQPQGRKRRRTFKPSKVSIDTYKPSSLNPLDLDAKDTSVGSSPTTIEGSRRSRKRKSNEIHDCFPVKVNITSFRVPELSINLPETATVASLKRAVMEAAVNLLGGGLHVRVLHHGKKVHDENSTLIQMGIACKDRLDSLAFMLEPSGVSNTSMNIGESIFAYPKVKTQHGAWY